MHVIREESNANLERTDTGEFESNLIAQYESIGTDIRGLLQEWEVGKSALLSNFDKQSPSARPSRPSSMLKSSPLSPTPSLGGSTTVEGSPSDALRALNGDNRSDSTESQVIDAEEIFEAVALPPRNKRPTLTREERIARVKEDRAKQSAARDRMDANTTMLKELEMVIKQRPHINKNSKRVTSI